MHSSGAQWYALALVFFALLDATGIVTPVVCEHVFFVGVHGALLAYAVVTGRQWDRNRRLSADHCNRPQEANTPAVQPPPIQVAVEHRDDDVDSDTDTAADISVAENHRRHRVRRRRRHQPVVQRHDGDGTGDVSPLVVE